MCFSNALFIIFAWALIILCMTCLIEAIQPEGYIAPLIRRTSPKHPLYNPNATIKDILREKKRISIARQLFFARQSLGSGIPNGVAPISFDVIMSYSIGTPPVESLAIPNTGSSLIWQQCQPCIKCFNQTKPIFDPAKSTTYQVVGCNSQVCNTKNKFFCKIKGTSCLYEQSYNDGTYKSEGTIGTDSLTLPGNEYYWEVTLPNTVFGCGTNNQIDFGTGFSGIVGLQNTSISLANQFGGDSFSYCTSENGGFIRFGKTARLSGSKTTLSTGLWDNIYQINLLAIAVGFPRNTSYLNISSDIFKVDPYKSHTGTTIDSGTSFSSLHKVAFVALVNKIKDFMAKFESYRTTEFWLCYNGDDDPHDISVEKMPSVSLVLDNMSLSFPNQNVWSEKNEDGDICLTILPSEGNITIIGDEQLKDFNVGFDLRENLIWFKYEPDCV